MPRFLRLGKAFTPLWGRGGRDGQDFFYENLRVLTDRTRKWLYPLTHRQVRDAKEAQAREHLVSLEELRLRSTAELREFGRELAANGEELEKAREAARGHDGRASKLQVLLVTVKLCHETKE